MVPGAIPPSLLAPTPFPRGWVAAIQRQPEALYASFIRSSAVTSQQGSLLILDQTPRTAHLTLTLTCPFSQPSSLYLSSYIAWNGFPLLSSVIFQALHCFISTGILKVTLVSCYQPWTWKVRYAIETIHLEGSGQADREGGIKRETGGRAWFPQGRPGPQLLRPACSTQGHLSRP